MSSMVCSSQLPTSATDQLTRGLAAARRACAFPDSSARLTTETHAQLQVFPTHCKQAMDALRSGAFGALQQRRRLRLSPRRRPHPPSPRDTLQHQRRCGLGRRPPPHRVPPRRRLQPRCGLCLLPCRPQRQGRAARRARVSDRRAPARHVEHPSVVVSVGRAWLGCGQLGDGVKNLQPVERGAHPELT